MGIVEAVVAAFKWLLIGVGCLFCVMVAGCAIYRARVRRRAR